MKKRTQNLRRRRRLARCLMLVAMVLAAVVPAIALLAPTEATMGDAQRIVYLHVPVAWLGLLGLLLTAGGGVMYLCDAESVVGPVVAGGGRTGLALLRPDAGDRLALGPRRLGNLVDLGPAAHVGLHPVDDLLGLSDPAGAVGRPSSPQPARARSWRSSGGGRSVGDRGGTLVSRHPPRDRGHGAGDAGGVLGRHGRLHGLFLLLLACRRGQLQLQALLEMTEQRFASTRRNRKPKESRLTTVIEKSPLFLWDSGRR